MEENHLIPDKNESWRAIDTLFSIFNPELWKKFSVFKETPEGLIFTVKVVPQSSKNEIMGWHEGVLKIRIAATPEKGQANKALIQFLAKTLKIPQKEIVILRGKTSQIKTILLHNRRISDISLQKD